MIIVSAFIIIALNYTTRFVLLFYNLYVKSGFFKLSNKYSNKAIFISAFALAIISLVFVVSAEMGETSSNTSYLLQSFIKSIIFIVLAVVWYLFCSRGQLYRVSLTFYYFAYIGILVSLLLCRLFGQVGGAYAWIHLGFISIQPSEFAKHIVIILGAKLFSKDYDNENVKMLYIYAALCFLYFVIIAFYQHDLGSAVIVLILCFCICLLNPYKQNSRKVSYLLIGLFVIIFLILFLLSPIATEIYKSHSDNYMLGRFLASSNPFDYAFDVGYHVVMSLITFGSGGLTGVGLGNSIHKHMNFPNPSTDFILPVVVEEGGLLTYIAIILLYLGILIPIIRYSLKTKTVYSRICLFGFAAYFMAHFILNVGGVTGLIPLTGVPLLLLSGGGSSLIACFGIIGSCQGEIIRERRLMHENRSGQV